MIFVTVGAQMPFDRLVRSVDEWACARDCNDVVAQIGKTKWRPRKIKYTPFLAPSEFTCHAARASIIVSHAGIGSIFTAVDLGKPIIVMPRRASLQETRNEHQLATVRRLAPYGVTIAMDTHELVVLLDKVGEHPAAHKPAKTTLPNLIEGIREFIRSAPQSVQLTRSRQTRNG